MHSIVRLEILLSLTTICDTDTLHLPQIQEGVFFRVRGQKTPLPYIKTTDSEQFYNPELKDPTQTLTKETKKRENKQSATAQPEPSTNQKRAGT
jgi:Tfp pilus assembly protein PilP